MAPQSLSTDLELGRPPGYAAFQCGAAGQAHNEAAFRHFLGIELRRAEASGQSVLLVLVCARPGKKANTRLTTSTARAIFEALGASVREVDFVGWFHEDRVAAATMVQHGHVPADFGRRIVTRVTEMLRAQVRDADRLLRLRVVVLKNSPNPEA
jgi:hypothetical protein